MRLQILEKKRLDYLLSRERQQKELKEDSPALDQILREILIKANQFVSSEAGSILLDEPFRKKEAISQQELVFVASFGLGSSRLPGLPLPINSGIVGATYLSGLPYLGKNMATLKDFSPKRDQLSRFKTKSIICAPIIIEASVCGVIELINRKGKKNFTEEDLKLLEIFAGYTSTLIQNVLYARTHIKMSKRDGLTGLYNDRFFYFKLDQEIRKARRRRDTDLVLLFMDLDHFKEVNDEYGHLTGSGVLQDVGMILRETATSQDATIARYGGDEFIIIFSRTSMTEANVVALAIRDAIEKFTFKSVPSFPKQRPDLIESRLTCSIGLASLKEHVGYGVSIAEARHLLIRKADVAMYSAKTKGKNRVCLSLSV